MEGMIMKKRVCLLIMASFMASALVGCGNASDTISEETETVSGEGETVTLWMPPLIAGTNDTISDKDFWTQELQGFADETGCNIDVEIIPWENYEEKYLSGLTSGEGPDIGYTYTEMMYDYAQMGIMKDLDPLFTEDEKSQYTYWDDGKFCGTQYQVPIYVGDARVLTCNMDILKAAGVEHVPTTWDELTEACNKVAESNLDVYPYIENWGMQNYGVMNGSFWPYFFSAGGELLDSEGNLNLNSDAGLAAVQYIYDMRFKNNILSESCTSIDTAQAIFEDGKAAMVMFPSSTTDSVAATVDFTIETCNALTGPNGDSATLAVSGGLVLFDDSDISVEALKYLTSKDVMNDYHKLVNGLPVRGDEDYYGSERFEEFYVNETDKMKLLPAFEGATSFYDALYKNLQSMLMGELKPQQVLDDTTDYYYEQITE